MRKGIFIPEITVEMFRNATLEAVEELLVSGTMEDIEIPDRPHGEWLSHYDYCKKHDYIYIPSGLFAFWWCNKCEQGVEIRTNFCPNCGASMQANDRQVTGKLDENTQKHYGFRKKY